MIGSISNTLSPNKRSVALRTGSLIIESVITSAAVLMPVWASVGIPEAVFAKLPVVISDITSACGNAGLDRTEAFNCSVSVSGPLKFTNI